MGNKCGSTKVVQFNPSDSKDSVKRPEKENNFDGVPNHGKNDGEILFVKHVRPATGEPEESGNENEEVREKCEQMQTPKITRL